MTLTLRVRGAVAFGAGLLLGILLTSVVCEAQQSIRIDTYDKYSNRTGYLLIDPKTGRVDSFDKYSNRQGSATVSPPPAQVQPGQTLKLQPVPGAAEVSGRR